MDNELREESVIREKWTQYPILPTGEENDEDWARMQETCFMLNYGTSRGVSLKLVVEALPVGPIKILDLGCNGVNLVKLLLTWGNDAYGADLPLLAERAKQEAPEVAHRFLPCDLEQEEIPIVGEEKYDHIFAFGVIEHLRNYRLFFSKAARALKMGGVLYLLTCNSKAVSVKEEVLHVKHFTRDELDYMARKAGFGNEGITSTSRTNLIGFFRKRSINEDSND